MIKYVTGDILTSNAAALVVPVNCVGAMGTGLALEFKQKYPAMFDYYRRLCDEGKMCLRKSHFYIDPSDQTMLVLFPTKDDWRETSDIMDIIEGLSNLVKDLKDFTGLGSIAFPWLGCEAGDGLQQNEMEKVMNYYLSRLPLDVYIYNTI